MIEIIVNNWDELNDRGTRLSISGLNEVDFYDHKSNDSKKSFIGFMFSDHDKTKVPVWLKISVEDIANYFSNSMMEKINNFDSSLEIINTWGKYIGTEKPERFNTVKIEDPIHKQDIADSVIKVDQIESSGENRSNEIPIVREPIPFYWMGIFKLSLFIIIPLAIIVLIYLLT